MFLDTIYMEVTVKNRDYVRKETASEEVQKFIKRRTDKKKTQLRKLQRRRKKENMYA
tara:strand:- start:643 stop:813 length:171 start_codon:yes stop_codon:yes gene_type:complete